MMIGCGQLPRLSCCHEQRALCVASPERTSGREYESTATTFDRGGKVTPSTIMSPGSELVVAGPSTEIRLGVFFFLSVYEGACYCEPRVVCERGPPKSEPFLEVQTECPRLTRGTFTDKESRNVREMRHAETVLKHHPRS